MRALNKTIYSVNNYLNNFQTKITKREREKARKDIYNINKYSK